MRLFACLFIYALGCGQAPPPREDAGPPQPVLLEVIAPSPAIEGTILEVRGLGLEDLGPDARLEIGTAGAIDATAGAPGEHLFELSAEVVAALGAGPHDVTYIATGNGLRSAPLDGALTIATELAITLDAVPGGEVHRNDVAVLSGSGFTSSTEGTLSAHLVGTFTPDASGTPASLDVSLPVSMLERAARDRGVMVLTTDVGGLSPGAFDGTVQLVSQLRSGANSTSDALAWTLHFGPPDLYSLDPSEAPIGRIVTVQGAGFLGGRDRPDETTIIRIAGTFTPDGGSAAPFGPAELVPEFVSGSAVRFVVEPVVQDTMVIAQLFGAARGELVGTATPVAIKGTDEIEGAATPFRFAVTGVTQVVQLRFLTGFFASLARFGLADAASEIQQGILARVQAIYEPWNLDFRLDTPQDFAETAYSVVEIGGPDPNGSGLFGYDNTPGKDVGNLRIFDMIGGANAETQADGARGYGGVFIDSYLYWSSHPELPDSRPSSAPDPDPLFDSIFDPVRANAATLAEVRGEGDPARVAQVQRAIDALGSLIGETAAHELGHSLGMAQPHGPLTAYHNDFDGEGCLMDAGGDRPLGERIQEPGFTPTMFCYDEPAYLDEILPR